MLFVLKEKFHKKLISIDNEGEFIDNINRVYYIIRNVKYKGTDINVAIPLRSNINHSFKKNKSEYIATVPTEHTKEKNVSGWHITKMIPVMFDNVKTIIKYNKEYKVAEFIAKVYKQELCDGVKEMLQRLERNEHVFGSVNFDRFLKAVYGPEERKYISKREIAKGNKT